MRFNNKIGKYSELAARLRRMPQRAVYVKGPALLSLLPVALYRARFIEATMHSSPQSLLKLPDRHDDGLGAPPPAIRLLTPAPTLATLR